MTYSSHGLWEDTRKISCSFRKANGHWRMWSMFSCVCWYWEPEGLLAGYVMMSFVTVAKLVLNLLFCTTTEINMTLRSSIFSIEWNWLNWICGGQWQCFIGFEVLTASTGFWDVTPCIAVEVHWRFGGTYCLHIQDRRVSHARSWDVLYHLLVVWLLASLLLPWRWRQYVPPKRRWAPTDFSASRPRTSEL
jgi:hypothetical protein